MNARLYEILKAFATRTETAQTRILAQREVERENRRRDRAAARAIDAHVEKAPIASVEHHAKERRAEERAEEQVSKAVWEAVLERTIIDHRGQVRCEACHRHALRTALEPHHLSMGSGHREDRVDWVMALCPDCHRLGPNAAHRRPRHFALTVVIPWARDHKYTDLPNRKEYRQ